MLKGLLHRRNVQPRYFGKFIHVVQKITNEVRVWDIFQEYWNVANICAVRGIVTSDILIQWFGDPTEYISRSWVKCRIYAQTGQIW